VSFVKVVLGRVARLARATGLARPLGAARDAIDAGLLRLRLPVLSAPVAGRRLRGFLRHRSFLAEIGRGEYEPTLRQLILESVVPGALFVDVGAHVGYYSVLAAAAGADVIAVEPDPYNRAALAANVRGLPVEVVAAAVADTVGQATFHPSASTTGSSLLARTDIELRRAVTVETTTVDTLVAGRFDRPLVVKLDVEGAEPLALAGAAKTLRATRLVVIAEVHPAALAARSFSPEDVVRLLTDAGCNVEFIDLSGSIRPVPTTATKGNLVARKG